MSENESNIISEDPFDVLGLQPDAQTEEIRAAYLVKVKRHPPDRDPIGFERVRKAFDEIQDKEQRVKRLLTKSGPGMLLVDSVPVDRVPPVFVGPDAWLTVLKEENNDR